MEKVNVPELFYTHHLSKLPNGSSTLLQKLEDTTPTSRGRGQTRTIEVTDAERSELLELSERFGVLKGIPSEERETTLRGAICAQSLNKRLRGIKQKPKVTTPTQPVQDATSQPGVVIIDEETTEEDFMIELGADAPTVEESEEDDTLHDEIIAELNNPLLQLLAKIRKQLMEGDYRALYEVWNIYGAPEYDDEEDEEGEGWPKPPVPEEKSTGGRVIEELARILDTI